MSRRREVLGKLRQLEEIGEIMRSMKNLALMETRKLGRYVTAQGQGIDFLESVAAEFLGHYPQPTPCAPKVQAVLAIGSERGFCGEYNEQLLGLLAELQAEAAKETRTLLIFAVGNKLCDRLGDRDLAYTALAGAMVAEELPHVASRIALSLADLQRQDPDLEVSVLAHGDGADGVLRKSLIPPFQQLPAGNTIGRHPPLLYVPPGQFYSELVQHYLSALLNQILHLALFRENEQRVRHLEGALQRLDEKTADLGRRSQSLRQEEITEEIEILLLSVEGLRG